MRDAFNKKFELIFINPGIALTLFAAYPFLSINGEGGVKTQ